MEEGKDKRESHASAADWSEDCTGCIIRTRRIPPSNDTDEFGKKTVRRIKEAEGVSERESRTHARTRMRTRTQAWTSCLGEPIDTTEGGYRRRVYAIQRPCVRAYTRHNRGPPHGWREASALRQRWWWCNFFCFSFAVTSSRCSSLFLTLSHPPHHLMEKSPSRRSKTHFNFERRRCANFSLVQRPVARNWVLRPDCAFLTNRLKCSLYKLNCPSHLDSSFQMYDIPCQSSCHVTVDICGMQAVSSQDISSRWQAYPKRSAPLYLSSTPSSAAHIRPTPGVVLPTWQQRSTPTSGQSVWPWRPYVPSVAHRRVPRASQNAAGNGSGGNEVKGRNGEGTWYLRHEDCRLLPAGGCDDWARKIIKHHRYYTRDYTLETRQNPGCPRNFEVICAKMFPQNFSKTDWKQGNFTVALIMRISQTFWWFGKFDRFQSFFRFNVKRTLKSDIVEYNEKIILTNAWPSTCPCPDKLVVGKKYLLLTHSRISRQTLRISTESVFLEKPKKYTRLILCWMGSCPRQESRNGRYGRNRWNWRWQKRRH
ncbi:hypothetical protein TcWFU_001265 [Taenia crassiceps]|uniref:Uncharacterized protein n=1 Tax=Taenia crassiceps TaxID=6207 RepID=A0ABR4QJN5_9CEST